MDEKTKNIAASVHQRLLNKSRESSRPFNELLQHFAIERFIYRLSKSPHADRFILKGALMFAARAKNELFITRSTDDRSGFWVANSPTEGEELLGENVAFKPH